MYLAENSFLGGAILLLDYSFWTDASASWRHRTWPGIGQIMAAGKQINLNYHDTISLCIRVAPRFSSTKQLNGVQPQKEIVALQSAPFHALQGSAPQWWLSQIQAFVNYKLLVLNHKQHFQLSDTLRLFMLFFPHSHGRFCDAKMFRNFNQAVKKQDNIFPDLQAV